MKKLLLLCYCFLSVFVLQAQQELLFQFCEISQLNNTQYQLESYFSGVDDDCFEDQVRLETVRHDTVFLINLYIFPATLSATGCHRRDTLERTQFSQEIHYVNVSAGIIKSAYTPPDTVWNRFDSTFAAPVGLPEIGGSDFTWSCTNDLLKITGNKPIESITVMSANGQQLFSQNGTQVNVSGLAAGIYFVRFFSQGSVSILRWYKE